MVSFEHTAHFESSGRLPPSTSVALLFISGRREAAMRRRCPMDPCHSSVRQLCPSDGFVLFLFVHVFFFFFLFLPHPSPSGLDFQLFPSADQEDRLDHDPGASTPTDGHAHF